MKTKDSLSEQEWLLLCWCMGVAEKKAMEDYPKTAEKIHRLFHKLLDMSLQDKGLFIKQNDT